MTENTQQIPGAPTDASAAWTEALPGDRPRRSPFARLSSLFLETGSAMGVVFLFLVFGAYFAFAQPHFATWSNARNILDTASIPLIVAIGMTFVVLATGFDLSVGGILAASGILAAVLAQAGVPEIVAIGAAIALAIVLGAINGYIIGFLGLDFFVGTLGTMSVYLGFCFIYTNGMSIPAFDAKLIVNLGSARPAGIPVPVIVAALVLLASWLVLHYTAFGRMIYAIGNSREASRLAGIPVSRIELSVYTISGLLSGIAGVLQTGRLTSASPAVAADVPLAAAAAVFLGGTALSGGIGGVGGTLLGVLLIGMISNGLDLAGVSAFWQSVITGVILIAALYLDRLRLSRIR